MLLVYITACIVGCGLQCNACASRNASCEPPAGFSEGPWLVLDPFHCIPDQHAHTDDASMVRDSAQEVKQCSTSKLQKR